jgi:hypothetical protein
MLKEVNIKYFQLAGFTLICLACDGTPKVSLLQTVLAL